VTVPPTVVFLVRHGRTELNAAGVLHGRLDPGLDDIGITQAAALGALFAGVELRAVVSSPLLRAVQTAQPIAASTGAGLIVDDALADRDYGPWAERDPTEVVARFGSLDAATGVELPDRFTARVAGAFDTIASGGETGAVVVVAHDAVNRAVLATLVPGLGDPDSIGQRTGCWNRLEHDGHAWAAPIVDGVPGDGHLP
jgi:broad specificity phosphatase PhoE